MSDIFQQTKPQNVLTPIYKPVLKVLGLGGGGGNAVTRMIELGLGGVEFIAANTDLQVLKSNPAPHKILLGPHVTRGLGAGGDPRLGKAAAEESTREIAAALTGADMVFLTAGMGGGTGTGAIPVAAEIARNLGAVTIAIVNTPFSFEMGRRQRNATEGLALLQKHSDTLISIPNDRLLYFDTRNLPLELAFRLADDVLRQAVQGISELITEPGMINVDFAHIRRLMKLGGGALMSIGYGEGENKAIKAIDKALHHPLLGSVSLDHAAGIIANFTGGADLTLHEVEAALTGLQEQACSQTEIVMGVINDDRLEDKVQVTLIITGLGAPTLEETLLEVSKPKTVVTKIEQPETVQMAEEQPMPNLPPTPLTATPSATDLDLPAFLRRRIRYAG
jgi:cell division protein FtsZ